MAKAVQTVAWDRTSILWATLANSNRDPAKHPRPFTPADIHPFRSEAEFKSKEDAAPDWNVIAQIKRQYKRTVLSGKRNQSRESLP